MSLLKFCGLIGHQPNRDRVWDDGLNYRTLCKRCGRPLLRESNGWVPFDADAHADERRAVKD